MQFYQGAKQVMTIVFDISKETQATVKKHCEKYETMTLDELKEVIRNLDQSEDQIFSNSDRLTTKEDILDFLFGWTWLQITEGALSHD